MNNWDKQELIKNSTLRDVLYFLFIGNTVNGETREEGQHNLMCLLEKKFPRLKESKHGLARTIRDAMNRGFITFDTGSKRLELSGKSRALLASMDIITSSCGASLVRVRWGAAMYCHNCGGLV